MNACDYKIITAFLTSVTEPMRVHRLYINAPLAAGEQINLNSDDVHYLGRVLRARSGQVIRVFNGRDHCEYRARISHISRGQLQLYIETGAAVATEAPLFLHLGQAIAKGDTFDWVVQKATELGVQAITPLHTRHCEAGKMNLEKKLPHWQKIARHAAEQCGRVCLPIIYSPASLSQWLLQQPRGIVLAPDAPARLGADLYPRPPGQLSCVVGPEGGLTADEISQCTTQGFIPVHLGPRILRAETAPLTMLSLSQSYWGDL